MKKLKWIILGGLFTVLFFLGGIYVGNLLSNVEDGYETNTIAIVNLDEGVQYDDTSRYFSNELMDINNETQYKITGLSDARNGVESGLYAGYIVINADFSRNVASVNDTPSKIEISYEIGTQLVEESKENAIYNVLTFETDLNNKLSNVYLYSVLNRFHGGQDGAQTVIQNDKADLELILSINAADLIAMVEITDVDSLDNNIDALDISQEVETGETIMNELDSSYKEFMNLTAEQLAQIKTDYGSLDTSLIDLESKLNSYPNTINDDGTLNFPLTDTTTYINDTNTAITNDINTAVTNHNSNLETVRTEITSIMGNQVFWEKSSIQKNESLIQNAIINYLKNNSVKTYGDAINDLEADPILEPIVIDYLTSQGVTVIVGDSSNPIMGQYDAFHSGYDQNSTNENFSKYVESMEAALKNVNIVQNIDVPVVLVDPDVVETKVQQEITNLNTQQAQVISDAKLIYSLQRADYDTLRDYLNTYDPLSNIDERTIEQLIRNYNSNITDIESAIIKKEDEYDGLNRNIYENSHEHISSLKEDVSKANEESNTKVTDGVSELQVVKEGNSTENQQVLSDFMGTLQNTRQGALTNTEVASFMTNPIEITGAISKSQTQVKDIKEYVEYGLIGTLGLTIITMSAILLSSMKKNKKEEG
ncbi:MAG: YhgE/Pip domain-containing protein [Coprobacillaceae bacterium]